MSEEAYKDITNAFIMKKDSETDSTNPPWNSDACVYHWHKKEGGVCYKDKGHWSKSKK